ncbi:MAG: zinc ribbon domain-containing protein [Lentisphaeria bacterium]|nr:zinc ribbon domain-containing protein [Lentisphaeria bacterium]
MLMKCSKCGYENQLNAIFCRGCGEKLNPAEVSPEALAEEAKKRKKAKRKINWSPIVGLILLAGVVTFGILLFTTPSDAPVYDSTAAVPYKDTLKLVERGFTATVTPEQLTAFFNEDLINKDAAKKGADYAIRDVIFTGNGNELTVTIHTAVLSCATTISATGTLKKGTEENPIQFNISKFRFGNVALPFGQEFILKKFENVFYDESLKEIFRKAEDVVFTNGNLEITQKRILKKTTKKNSKKSSKK